MCDVLHQQSDKGIKHDKYGKYLHMLQANCVAMTSRNVVRPLLLLAQYTSLYIFFVSSYICIFLVTFTITSTPGR